MQICSQFGHGLISFDGKNDWNCKCGASISRSWATLLESSPLSILSGLNDCGLALVSFRCGEYPRKSNANGQAFSRRITQSRLKNIRRSTPERAIASGTSQTTRARPVSCNIVPSLKSTKRRPARVDQKIPKSVEQ
jgi:hypothetical protein